MSFCSESSTSCQPAPTHSDVEVGAELRLLRFMVSRYKTKWPLPAYPYVPAYTCLEPDPPTVAPFLDALAAFLPFSSQHHCALTLAMNESNAIISVAAAGDSHYQQQIRNLLMKVWDLVQGMIKDRSFPIVALLTSTFIQYHFLALTARFHEEHTVVRDFLSWVDSQLVPVTLRELFDFTRQVLVDGHTLYNKELPLDDTLLAAYVSKLRDGLCKTKSVKDNGDMKLMQKLWERFSEERRLWRSDSFQNLLNLYWPVRHSEALVAFFIDGTLAFLKETTLSVSFISPVELDHSSDRSLGSGDVGAIIDKVHRDYCPEVSEVAKKEIRKHFMDGTDKFQSKPDCTRAHPEMTLILHHLCGALHPSQGTPFPYIASSIPCCFACRIFLRAVRVVAVQHFGIRFCFTTRMTAAQDVTKNYEGIKDTEKWADWCFPFLPSSLSSTKPLIVSLMREVVYRMMSFRLIEHEDHLAQLSTRCGLEEDELDAEEYKKWFASFQDRVTKAVSKFKR